MLAKVFDTHTHTHTLIKALFFFFLCHDAEGNDVNRLRSSYGVDAMSESCGTFYFEGLAIMCCVFEFLGCFQ